MRSRSGKQHDDAFVCAAEFIGRRNRSKCGGGRHWFVNPDAFDIVITTSDFADLLHASRAKIVRIDNMMDKSYLKEQLLRTIKEI